LASMVAVPWYLMSGLACYCLARQLRTPRPLALLSAVLVAAVPSLCAVGLPGDTGAMTDASAVAALGAAMTFLLRHAQRPRPGELALAGLALGLALGTKWYGLTYAGLLGLIWAAAVVLRGGRGSSPLARLR